MFAGIPNSIAVSSVCLQRAAGRQILLVARDGDLDSRSMEFPRMEQNKEAITQWSDSAAYWEKHRVVICEMFAPVTEALIAAAGITRGSTVLDIAMGPGEPALSIAAFVGPQGKVVGADPIPDMVEAARKEASRQHLANATFEVAFADSLPFPANSFDSVVSRFGAMFFPSPADAVREILRVLKPGGILALAVWHYAEENPFHYCVSQVVDRYVEPPPPVPGALDAFRFAKPGELLEIVAGAGAISTFERMLDFLIRAQLPPEDFWILRSEMSDKFRKKLASLSPQKREALTREVIEAMHPYIKGDCVVFPAKVLIVTGKKPA
jgi:ubiquinone/menaquinone biosynthesis C-methylase UbiE